MRHALLAACAALVTLASAGPASAHVVPQPQFLASGEAGTLALAGPNERDETMTGLSVTVPEGLHILRAEDTGDWTATVDERTAIWAGGRLEPMVEASFELELDVSAEPGTVTLATTQLYPDGETVDWPVSLTIVPGAGGSDQNLGWALVAAAAGLVLTVGVVLVLWRRRSGALQER